MKTVLKKYRKTILIVTSMIVFLFSILFLSFLFSNSGVTGTYEGVLSDSRVEIVLNVFNKGTYSIDNGNGKKVYQCTWTNRMVYPHEKVEQEYIRSDGLFSTIDIRYFNGSTSIQKQFYNINHQLISYSDKNFVLIKK